MPCLCSYPREHTEQLHKEIAHQHRKELETWIAPESQQESPEWKKHPFFVSKAYQKGSSLDTPKTTTSQNGSEAVEVPTDDPRAVK